MEEQKAVNVKLNKRVNTVESPVNKRIDGFHNEIAQKIDNLQYSISRLTNQHQVQEKGKFPSQTQQNPRRVHEIVDNNRKKKNNILNMTNVLKKIPKYFESIKQST